MRILEFWSKTCVPCRTSKASIATLRAEGFPVKIEELDIADHADLVQQLGVRSVPTMVVLSDDGEEVCRKVGPQSPDEMEAFLNDFIQEGR